jgi:transposase
MKVKNPHLFILPMINQVLTYNLCTANFVRKGINRDKNSGTPQNNFALMTDRDGRPLSISVFPGNTPDYNVIIHAADKIREDYNVSAVVMVSDREMISSEAIAALKLMEGMDWIGSQPSRLLQYKD